MKCRARASKQDRLDSLVVDVENRVHVGFLPNDSYVPIADGRVGFVALSLKRLTKPLISAWGRTFISGVGKANNHLRDDFAFLPIDLVFD